MYNYASLFCQDCPFCELMRNASVNPVSATVKNIVSNTEEIKEYLRLPVLSGSTNKQILNYINSNLQNDILEFKKQMENAASQNAATKKAQKQPVIPYEISNTYSITYNKNNIISISLIYAEILNRIPYYIKVTYNYDLTNGTSLQLKNLFKPNTNYKNILNTEISNNLKKAGTSKTPFGGISEDQPFYLDNNKLVIFLGFNEIGFSANSIPIIEIPFSKLSTVMKPEVLRCQ